MSAPVVYFQPNSTLLTLTDVNKLFELAQWEERTSARYEAFWSTENKPYTYGQGAGKREYWPRPMPAEMVAAKDFTEKLASQVVGKPVELQLCFLNRYDHQHQHLGWHADDSPEQDDDMPIVVQSFGGERELWFRSNGGTETERQLLENGSTLIMLPGMQQTHQHRIPKHPQPVDMRISLTWRALK